jgi:hypothetical protein
LEPFSTVNAFEAAPWAMNTPMLLIFASFPCSQAIDDFTYVLGVIFMCHKHGIWCFYTMISSRPTAAKNRGCAISSVSRMACIYTDSFRPFFEPPA